SRTQRFDLRRIPHKGVIAQLAKIVEQESIRADPAALDAIARQAQGSLRDAESMLDMVIAFANGPITLKEVDDLLGASDWEETAEHLRTSEGTPLPLELAILDLVTSNEKVAPPPDTRRETERPAATRPTAPPPPRAEPRRDATRGSVVAIAERRVVTEATISVGAASPAVKLETVRKAWGERVERAE